MISRGSLFKLSHHPIFRITRLCKSAISFGKVSKFLHQKILNSRRWRSFWISGDSARREKHDFRWSLTTRPLESTVAHDSKSLSGIFAAESIPMRACLSVVSIVINWEKDVAFQSSLEGIRNFDKCQFRGRITKYLTRKMRTCLVLRCRQAKPNDVSGGRHYADDWENWLFLRTPAVKGNFEF